MGYIGAMMGRTPWRWRRRDDDVSTPMLTMLTSLAVRRARHLTRLATSASMTSVNPGSLMRQDGAPGLTGESLDADDEPRKGAARQ